MTINSTWQAQNAMAFGNFVITPSDGNTLALKVRAVLLVASGFIAVLLTIGAVDRMIVQPAFDRLQRAQALEDGLRAHGAIQGELGQLGRTLVDWSNWDNTYQFAKNRNPEYLQSNFSEWAMLESGTQINLCVILGAEGQILYRGGYAAKRGGDLIPGLFAGNQPAGRDLLRPVWTDGRRIEGLLETEAGLYLAAARPIMTTQGTGPSSGALLMARLLQPELQQELAEQVQVAFNLFVQDDPRLSPAERALWQQLQPGQPWVDAATPSPAFVYELLVDLYGRPAVLLRTPIRQDISTVARQTSRALIGTLGLAAVALVLAIAVIARRGHRERSTTTVSAAWGSATLVMLIGLGLTIAAFSELQQMGTRSTDAYWILVIGSVVTLFCTLYLFTLITQQARAEAVIAVRTTQLEESEARFRGIVTHAPIGIFVFGLQAEDALILTAANPAADTILMRRLSQQGDLRLEALFPPLSHTDLPQIFRQLALDGGMRHWDSVDYCDELIAGSFEMTAFQNAPGTITVMFADISERRQAELGLQQRDRLLQATADAMAELLSQPVFDRAIQSALGILGRTVEADRACVFQNAQDAKTGQRHMNWLTAWRATDAAPSEPDPELRALSCEPRFSGWWERLSAGESIAGPVSELPTPAREFLTSQGIESLLVLPILMQNQCWGFIGFADCRLGRAWTTAEDGVLRAVAAALGNAYVRHHAEERQRLASAVFESVSESIIVTDAERRILAVNPAFTQITGYQEAEVLGREPSFLKSGRLPDAYYAGLWDCIESAGTWQGEFINRHKNGELYVVLSTITAVRSEFGQLTHYVGTATDITRQKEIEQRIEHLAYFDPLTDLPNRSLLIQRADLALSLAARSKMSVALLFMDLDFFKDVNDSLGHSEGDRLLVQAASRLAAIARSSDTLCRLGGDEFVLLLEGEQHGAQEVARKLLKAFREPFSLLEHHPRVTLSIGIAIYPQDGKTFGDLLKNADTALYQAKDNGRNAYAFFNREMQLAAVERLVMGTELRTALAAGELRAYYQPKVRLADGRLLGAEALVRWEHPAQGLLLPGAFIQVAEASGLIVDLGDWMMAEVCRQLAAWHRAGYPPVSVAVNLAAQHFRSHNLAERISGLLAEHKLPARSLSLELTESSLLDSGATTLETLKSLKALGIDLAIDDFGTGYSSLSYLRDLPISALKIDRRFVRDLSDRPDDRVLASTIVALGHALGLAVIAEGVETDAQRSILIEQGCDQAQGFFFGHPVPAKRFADDWLRRLNPVS
jgi:diguanylate cyclase (GGDEF)-like protein/PAS domain S-box-containing protein